MHGGYARLLLPRRARRTGNVEPTLRTPLPPKHQRPQLNLPAALTAALTRIYTLTSSTYDRHIGTSEKQT
jgi:hypothetical protein